MAINGIEGSEGLLLEVERAWHFVIVSSGAYIDALDTLRMYFDDDATRQEVITAGENLGLPKMMQEMILAGDSSVYENNFLRGIKAVLEAATSPNRVENKDYRGGGMEVTLYLDRLYPDVVVSMICENIRNGALPILRVSYPLQIAGVSEAMASVLNELNVVIGSASGNGVRY